MLAFRRWYVNDLWPECSTLKWRLIFLLPLTVSTSVFLSFTIEFPVDNKIPFIGIEIIKNGTQTETEVLREPTITDLKIANCKKFATPVSSLLLCYWIIRALDLRAVVTVVTLSLLNLRYVILNTLSRSLSDPVESTPFGLRRTDIKRVFLCA